MNSISRILPKQGHTHLFRNFTLHTVSGSVMREPTRRSKSSTFGLRQLAKPTSRLSDPCRLRMPIPLKRLSSKTALYLKVKPLPTDFYRREALQPGNQIPGPAIVTEFSATTVIPPNFSAVVDAYQNLLLRRR